MDSLIDVIKDAHTIRTLLVECDLRKGLLRQKCEQLGHFPELRSKSIVCAGCRKDFGWACPKNPNAMWCEYPKEWNGGYCIHCRQPDERK